MMAGGEHNKIEITPEMIDAGVEEFLSYYPETGTGDRLDRRMVERIYTAMRSTSWDEKNRMRSVRFIKKVYGSYLR